MRSLKRLLLKISKNFGLLLSILIKKRPWHRCFPVKCTRFFENIFADLLWATASVFTIIPLMTNVLHHRETGQSICIVNQLTGFYMMGNMGR